ncbi:hypothetical protein [Streptomyces sp. CB02923]|uniref:hypothetical protein n=1 Tax=Streptomyces sp. CB02923 TaxID=1718985 RepID=UPI001901949A|nr:hypothetical protein [Streptomyces sp. CB02923]
MSVPPGHTAERSGTRAVLRAVHGEVGVSADAATLAELGTLSAPFLTPAPWPEQAAPGGLPSVLVREAPPRGGAWQRVSYSSEYEPDRVLWMDRERLRVAVVGPPSSWRDQQVLRSVRNLLRWQSYARGDLFVHGGLVGVGGKGIAFLGGKRSGKTSSILSALLNGRADFVSNDDVVFTGDDTGLTGHGFPRSVNLRTDALLALAAAHPGLTSLLTGTSHPTNGFRGRHFTTEALTTEQGEVLPGSVWVRCAELAAVTGCALRPAGELTAVVFPAFDDAAVDPVPQRLEAGEARAALLENVEDRALKYDPFLAQWFPTTHRERRTELIDRLIREVPCYRLRQNMRHLRTATHALFTELGLRPGERR